MPERKRDYLETLRNNQFISPPNRTYFPDRLIPAYHEFESLNPGHLEQTLDEYINIYVYNLELKDMAAILKSALHKAIKSNTQLEDRLEDLEQGFMRISGNELVPMAIFKPERKKGRYSSPYQKYYETLD